MLKYTSMNLEKKRELNNAHAANARAAKKASLKRKLESPTPTSTGNTAVATTLEVNPTTSKENTSDENQPNAPAVSQQPPRKVQI